jgi:hypothetical protein
LLEYLEAPEVPGRVFDIYPPVHRQPGRVRRVVRAICDPQLTPALLCLRACRCIGVASRQPACASRTIGCCRIAIDRVCSKVWLLGAGENR